MKAINADARQLRQIMGALRRTKGTAPLEQKILRQLVEMADG